MVFRKFEECYNNSSFMSREKDSKERELARQSCLKQLFSSVTHQEMNWQQIQRKHLRNVFNFGMSMESSTYRVSCKVSESLDSSGLVQSKRRPGLNFARSSRFYKQTKVEFITYIYILFHQSSISF